MKLKVGDFVKIREDLIDDGYYDTPIKNAKQKIYFNPKMGIYKGKIARVVRILEGSDIKLDIDKGCVHSRGFGWFWAESMLEKIKLNKEELFSLYLNKQISKEEFKKLIKEMN